MKQLTLFDDILPDKSGWKVESFSADNKYSQAERKQLEQKYWPITEITTKFNRQSVSFQLSKKDRMQRWLKYKEGFSAELVRILINEFGVRKGQTIMDPFIGSGTTALVACMNGINSLGFDILPMSKIAINAKLSVYNYSINELQKMLYIIKLLDVPQNYNKLTPEISITKGGYSIETSKAISYYTEYFRKSDFSNEAKELITLCILNTLEPVSYSIKAGQYLKWDTRSPKIIKVNQDRIARGKTPISNNNNKGILPSFKDELIKEVATVISDIEFIQKRPHLLSVGKCNYIEGSALYELPTIEDNSINGVISSPPYCNRYDYTRTYALELAYLGVDDDGIKKLRQNLLSCTVESKTKLSQLKDYYIRLKKSDDYNKIVSVIENNKALREIILALNCRNRNGEINNNGVIRMVEGYFTELAFIFAEIYRICKTGSYVGFVNDNVRYAGEVIPVDFLTTQIASDIGFTPIKIYTLQQTKGNSSQQMARYGRVPLRKSITIWKK